MENITDSAIRRQGCASRACLPGTFMPFLAAALGCRASLGEAA